MVIMMIMVMTLMMAVVTMMMIVVMVTMMMTHEGSLQLLLAIWQEQEPTSFGVKIDLGQYPIWQRSQIE